LGFLSAYEGTQRIDLGDGYWVDVKKCISIVEKQRAEQTLVANPTISPTTGHGSAKLDTTGFADVLMEASIVAWNLDDDDGTVWPLSPAQKKRDSIHRLPAPVYDQIYQVVDELNGPGSQADRQRFPGAGVGGDLDGSAGAPVVGGLFHGEPAVAAPRPAQGGLGAPPPP
jgi:hypothetical protein